jgi:hypothetical protein
MSRVSFEALEFPRQQRPQWHDSMLTFSFILVLYIHIPFSLFLISKNLPIRRLGCYCRTVLILMCAIRCQSAPLFSQAITGPSRSSMAIKPFSHSTNGTHNIFQTSTITPKHTQSHRTNGGACNGSVYVPRQHNRHGF